MLCHVFLTLLVIGWLSNNCTANAAEHELTPVNYTHNGDELQGFMTVPEEEGKVPAVVIIPDWDGVNDYEKLRAQMIASEFGYIGFAADIYGKDLHEVTDSDLRRELADLYRNNATLFASRIQSAVETVQGVLTYAITGTNGQGVKAVVSFHGGLSQVPSAMDNITVTPKVLVLSGGSDDASSEIMDLEIEMDAVKANWEITRYSNIQHAFTVFGDDRYNTWADMRSWSSTREFLMEAFGELVFESSPPSELGVSALNYIDTDGTELRGYLAKPGSLPTTGSLLPAVVILPDWDGNNQYEKERATLLADLGYIAFAADIYGADFQTNLTDLQRNELYGVYTGNPSLFVQRIERGIEEVKKVDGVDPTNIAVIGYCFGGTGIIELAFSGNDEVKLVVSFHGGLRELPESDAAISPYVLVLSGGIDDAHGNQAELESALDASDADWEITRYSGVGHGFTKWDSPNFSLKADYRSWQSMISTLTELLPMKVSDTNTMGGKDSTQDDTIKSDVAGAQFVVSALFAAFVLLAL